ncbi:MAG: hypothetical protein V7K69_09615 [Nostoc sp.]|uniref:hypothetical protein n=1 Tax=Nostoc sp. TaxID=1180 RepID=UPI002FF9F79E
MINNIFKRFAVSTACAVLSLGVMKANPTLAATFSISAREVETDGNLTFLRNYFGAFSGEDSDNDLILTLGELTNFTFESEPFFYGQRKFAYELADLESFTYNLSNNQLDLFASKFFDFSCVVGSDVRLYYSSNLGRGGSAADCDGTVLTSWQVAKIPSQPPVSIPEAGTTTALIIWGVGKLLNKRAYLTKTL